MSVANPSLTRPSTGNDAIRPFRVEIPQEAIDDMKRRVAATRWPDREFALGVRGIPLNVGVCLPDLRVELLG
jgi:hypothetical protein